jgi:DNA-directed RNA polymerase subunit RPC12/RpoP
MWPFAKKEKQSVTKINEEEPKQPVALQLKFDPMATQRWLDSQRAESEKKEPEPAPEVKLECPTCKQTLEKFSYRRFKCPKCRSWIYFKGGCLVTKEERDKIQEEFYRKAKADELAEIGITEEMIQQREQELINKAGVKQNRYSVIMSLFNETILKLKSLDEMEQRYIKLAGILNRAGEEMFHILKAAQETRLAIYRKEGFENVRIVTHEECEACRELEGKVISITEALRTMPLPIKECAAHPWNEDLSFCTCWYSSEWDDEYTERQSNE